MKVLKFLSVLFLLFFAILITSCENEPIDSALLDAIDNGGGGVDGGGGTDDGGTGGGGTDGGGTGGGSTGSSFTAKIGSFNFVAKDIEAEISDSAFGTELNINGITSDGKIMSIQMIKPVMGTFTATSSIEKLLIFQYSFFDNLNANFFSSFDITNDVSAGSLTITKFDLVAKKISGTFSFTGFDSLGSTNKLQITNGVINNVSFTTEP